MKLAPYCYDCLHRLIHQAADLATDDASLRHAAIRKATSILDDEFSYDQLSIVIATRIHSVIREVARNADPYRAMKEKEMKLARELHPELSLQVEQAGEDELSACIRLAAVANSIDFFRETHSTERDIRSPVSFEVDDSARLEAKLTDADMVLYLADNAGEIYFDLPLVSLMRRFAQVVYVVKPSPVQNDLTLEDVARSNLDNALGEVMSTGIASPGVILSLTSAPFKRAFESADLIFAKGMGHYEALSELPAQGRVFHCLMAKCKPVAKSLGVPLNSYVAMLR